MASTIVGPDGKPRCGWCGSVPEFLPYHDDEWGFPVDDDQRLFEKLCLESFQSGLSWRTILNKRENFRRAFKDFDFHRVAKYRERDIERLLGDPGIVRNRAKIEAVVHNSKSVLDLIAKEGSLAAFLWRYEPAQKASFKPQTATTSSESVALSKELKKRGWKFVGPTTIYSLFQAMGLINDHALECVTRKEVERARKRFQRPQ